jgi:hypothetical protein
MKKTWMVLGFMLGIAGALYAQENPLTDKNLSPEDRMFNLPPFSTKKEYRIQLGRGNVMELQLAVPSDLDRFENIDSLLLVFTGDMKAFRDSLADPLTTKQIDYVIDSSGQKKVRIRQSRPGTAFLLDSGEPAQLRLTQDTIYILIAHPAPMPSSGKKGQDLQYDRLGFFVNRYSELESYIATGLNRKIHLIKTALHTQNSYNIKAGQIYLIADPSITRVRTGNSHDRLELNGFVNAQNYKNYFVPSFVLGAAAQIFRGYRHDVYGIYWEPLFLFAPNGQGRLQTYRNDLLVVRYGIAHEDESGHESSVNSIGFGSNFSIGYLIGSQGNLIPAHTFRITLGSLKALKGGFHLDPCLYFNDFFKGVTPGLRLSLGGF